MPRYHCRNTHSTQIQQTKSATWRESGGGKCAVSKLKLKQIAAEDETPELQELQIRIRIQVHRYRWTDRWTDRQADTQTGGQTDRWTDRQAGTQTGSQTDRQINRKSDR